MRIANLACVPLLLIAGCSQAPDAILLDTWWDRNYAELSCTQSKRCNDDPVVLARDFEIDLITHFAAQADCRAVQVLTFEGPTMPQPPVVASAMQRHYWLLHIDFEWEPSKQSWQLFENGKPNPLQGTGIASTIAREVCGIVKAKGAKIAN